ncbi:MAG: TetR/AcrR family transcriptional regulator [Burkholderiales bacterium]|nr:TetR/AcrR family transcriptional regulator [Burkholderiales bacterium]
MAQVKKTEVREALLASAHRLFAKRGYAKTGVAQIAAGARVSEANLYVYFHSKLDLFFGVYEPWLRERIHRLEGQLASQRSPRRRLHTVLKVLWRELPADDGGFTNNLIQALSTTERREGYKPTLLNWVEGRVETMLQSTIPPTRWKALKRGRLVHMLVMAQDGFALASHLDAHGTCPAATLDMMVDLLLGSGKSRA